jgi:hypothetical protein
VGAVEWGWDYGGDKRNRNRRVLLSWDRTTVEIRGIGIGGCC